MGRKRGTDYEVGKDIFGLDVEGQGQGYTQEDGQPDEIGHGAAGC